VHSAHKSPEVYFRYISFETVTVNVTVFVVEWVAIDIVLLLLFLLVVTQGRNIEHDSTKNSELKTTTTKNIHNKLGILTQN